MARSIAESTYAFNKNISKSTKESRVTTPKLTAPNIPYLKVLRFHFQKGNGATYLKPENWPQELIKFGGRELGRTAQKDLWRKMRALKYVRYERMYGNRNCRYIHFITEAGLKALDEWEKKRLGLLKNRPSTIKKPTLELEKTDPPLNHDERRDNHVDPKALECLISMGIYRRLALKLLKKYSDNQLGEVYQEVKKKKPIKPGAYFVKLLKVKFG